MVLVRKLDPLLDRHYSVTRLKRLIFSEQFILQLFKKGLHLAYDIHSDEVPEDAEIMDVVFDKGSKEFHIVIRSDEFDHIKVNEIMPYLIPIAQKIKDAK